jgi:hypothetical protein
MAGLLPGKPSLSRSLRQHRRLTEGGTRYHAGDMTVVANKYAPSRIRASPACRPIGSVLRPDTYRSWLAGAVQRS